MDDLKWLYTALTRAVRKVYLVNFKDEFFAVPEPVEGPLLQQMPLPEEMV